MVNAVKHALRLLGHKKQCHNYVQFQAVVFRYGQVWMKQFARFRLIKCGALVGLFETILFNR
jgi:hypothetical protein